jgi:hypothetical protein
MKKIVGMIAGVFAAAVLIVGCGSNSKLDPIGGGSPYAFINASPPIKIEESGKDYNLSVQLIENGFGAPGEEVKMMPFDRKYGVVEPAVVDTDESGWAGFNYTAPEDLGEVSGQSITIRALFDDGNGSVIAQDFVLNFINIASGSLYHLTNQSTPIVISLDMNDTNNTTPPAITKEISAYVVDKDNIGVAGKEVTIGILDQQFGSISPSSTQTDAAGKATFTFTASDTIASQSGRSTVVNMNYTENGVTQSLPVTIEVTACCGCPGHPGTCP